MTDTLRDRIAAAIRGVDDWRGVTDSSILADAVVAELKLQPDAVIRELGLDRQAHYDPDCYYRYITEWFTDVPLATDSPDV